MRSLVILMGVVVALVNSQNATNQGETSSNVQATNSSTRLPRGTVYQIRPISFDDTSDSNPFTALDSIAGIDLAKLKSRDEPNQPERDSNFPSPSSSNVRVINLKDSDAVEAVDIPKFLLSASSGPVGRREFSNDDQEEESADLGKREPKPSSSQPVPIHSEDGAEEPWDASYAFGYTLEDQARHEVSDPDGNIRGYYQYVDDEGYVRKVVYTAGAGKGFVVLNKEKVKGPRPYHPSPPKKTNHHHSNKLGNAPPGYDPRPSSSRPPGPRPNRPRPNYPQSSDADFDFPESPKSPPPSGPSSSPPRPGWTSPSPPSPPSPPRLGWTSGKEGGGRRPIYVVKIRKPQHKHGEDEDDGPPGGYFTNKDDSSEDSGQWDGDVGYGPVYKYRGGKKGHVSGQPRPDGSYTFGYETETANRLEKSDNFGNVRGSYSYIDNEGIKRTVHYIAGATTGFQVLGSSPSSSRSVRIEAPPGFVVTRRNAPAVASSASTVTPTLSTAESEYPGFPPNVIVYHIQADANSLNLSPWWDAFGYSKRPRKMRRIMRVHRKKPRNFRKSEDDEEDEQQQGFDKETQIQQGLSDIQIEDETGSTSTPQTPTRERALPPTDNLDNAVPLSAELSPSSVDTSSPRPMYLIRTRSDNDRPRPFRHSTKVHLDNNFDMKTYFVRARRPSHRAYTKNFFGPESETSSSSGEERDHNDPILLGPSHSSLRARRRLPVPNPILLKPSSSRISVRSRGARLDVAESNAYPVVSTPPSGDEVQAPPTPNPVELFAAGNLETGDASPREVSTSKSMQLSISSSTTRIPVSSETPSSVTPNPPSTTPEPPTTPTPTSTPSPRENTLTLTDKEFEHTGIAGGIMSSSTRLMQRLGVQQPNLGGLPAAQPDNQN